MRVPLTWLQEFTPLSLEYEELGVVFDSLGLVVASITRVGEGLDGVVVSKVLEIEPIKGADKIRKVTVDTGLGITEIVCGANNFAVGDFVPMATVGAVLPGGFEIKARKMKGVASNGMLCSSTELGLGEDSSGLMILGSGSNGLEIGLPIKEALGIVNECVFDLETEGNRPDALSIAGVARDVAAKLKLPFLLDSLPRLSSSNDSTFMPSVVIESPELCSRFSAQVLTDVKVEASDARISRRLIQCGMRPINSLVDASNYVMLEIGQPTHPYDFDLLNAKTLKVRSAWVGETLETLDGVTRVLGESVKGVTDETGDAVICDGSDKVIGIAGIMGGASSEISDSTTTVVLEAAYFDPMAIARTSRRIGLRSEASQRFERGVDPMALELAQERYAYLIGAKGSARLASPVVIAGQKKVEPKKIRVRPNRVNTILGTNLSSSEITPILNSLGFETLGTDTTEDFEVSIPTFRPDAEREIDVIEEIARIIGYQEISPTQVYSPKVGRLSAFQEMVRKIRQVFVGLGSNEIWTNTLVAPNEQESFGVIGENISASRPLTKDESVLRRTLLLGLVNTYRKNALNNLGEARFFEIGHIFFHPKDVLGDLKLNDGQSEQFEIEKLRPYESERVSSIFALAGDDAKSAVEALYALLAEFSISEVKIVPIDKATVDQEHGYNRSTNLSLTEISSQLYFGGPTWHPMEPPQINSTVANIFSGGLHPARSGFIVTEKNEVIGVVGEIDPEITADFSKGRVGYLDIDLNGLFALGSSPSRYQSISRFPIAETDLAFVVDESVASEDIRKAIVDLTGEIAKRIYLFDVYRDASLGSGKKSLAYRLILSDPFKTLTDEDVAVIRDTVIKGVGEMFKASLRGV